MSRENAIPAERPKMLTAERALRRKRLLIATLK
jgi:hypothetical protein